MFHISQLGGFSKGIAGDLDGYIPELGDSPWNMNYDHGYESTHDADGNLTEYGEWFAEEFRDGLAGVIAATAASVAAIKAWNEQN